MTPTEITNDVRSQFDDTGIFITEADLRKWLWEALYILCDELSLIEDTDSSITTVAGTDEYTVPENIMRFQMVEWGGQVLIRRNLEKFLSLRGKNPPQGETRYYLWRGKTITLHPIPDRAETLKIWAFLRPTQITPANSSTDLFTLDGIREEYQQLTSDYMLWRTYLKDDDVKAREHQAQWLQAVKDAKLSWRKKRNRGNHTTVINLDTSPFDVSFL